MSRSLWTIAELAWRQINPGGKDEAKNTLEEFVETAKDEYASAAFSLWIELRNETDFSIIEQLLTRKKYEVKEDINGLYTDLETTIMDFPRDLGLFKVVPPKQDPLTKTTLGTYDLFKEDTGEKTYYRISKQIFYPDGFEIPTKEVMITLVSSDFIDEEIEIPDTLASRVRDAVLKKYLSTNQIQQDETNNKNANV